VAFTLDKRLPIASGIGGGSADAAAALRLLTRLWQLNLPPSHVRGGSQSWGRCAACLGSQTMFGSGVGERLETVDLDITGQPVLLVNPLVPCPTGAVFKAWDGVDRGSLDPAQWMQARNDLEVPALQLVPEIGAVLERLQQTQRALPACPVPARPALRFTAARRSGMRGSGHSLGATGCGRWRQAAMSEAFTLLKGVTRRS